MHSLLCKWLPCDQQVLVPSPIFFQAGILPKGRDVVAGNGQSPEARCDMELQVPAKSHPSHCWAVLGDKLLGPSTDRPGTDLDTLKVAGCGGWG